MEQVLFVQKELDVFKIPPRVGAGGWRSGEWRLSDKIFSGRCRVVAHGDALEVRLEDPQSGELFGVAPVPPGQAHIAVEQASDSSRNFVLRLEDAASRRHAFVGLSFAERSAAFDFNVAIQDHERQQKRDAEMDRIRHSADPLAAAAASELMPEAAALYRTAGDLSLREGETIKITVRKKEASAGAEGDSFLARMGHAPAAAGSGSAAGGGLKLAPPPGQPAMVLPPPPVAAAGSTAAAPQQQQQQQPADLLGAFGAFDAIAGSGSAAAAAPAAAGSAPAAAPATEGWATFE